MTVHYFGAKFGYCVLLLVCLLFQFLLSFVMSAIDDCFDAVEAVNEHEILNQFKGVTKKCHFGNNLSATQLTSTPIQDKKSRYKRSKSKTISSSEAEETDEDDGSDANESINRLKSIKFDHSSIFDKLASNIKTKYCNNQNKDEIDMNTLEIFKDGKKVEKKMPTKKKSNLSKRKRKSTSKYFNPSMVTDDDDTSDESIVEEESETESDQQVDNNEKRVLPPAKEIVKSNLSTSKQKIMNDKGETSKSISDNGELYQHYANQKDYSHHNQPSSSKYYHPNEQPNYHYYYPNRPSYYPPPPQPPPHHYDHRPDFYSNYYNQPRYYNHDYGSSYSITQPRPPPPPHRRGQPNEYHCRDTFNHFSYGNTFFPRPNKPIVETKHISGQEVVNYQPRFTSLSQRNQTESNILFSSALVASKTSSSNQLAMTMKFEPMLTSSMNKLEEITFQRNLIEQKRLQKQMIKELFDAQIGGETSEKGGLLIEMLKKYFSGGEEKKIPRLFQQQTKDETDVKTNLIPCITFSQAGLPIFDFIYSCPNFPFEIDANFHDIDKEMLANSEMIYAYLETIYDDEFEP